MNNKNAIEKWGKFTVTYKRADELEVGDSIFAFLKNLNFFTSKINNIVKYGKSYTIITFEIESSVGEIHNVKFTTPNNNIFVVYI